MTRGRFPCGVPTCTTQQVIVEQDDRWTLVECTEHNARTRWRTVEPEVKEQQIIRVQDSWGNYGVTGKPKGKVK